MNKLLILSQIFVCSLASAAGPIGYGSIKMGMTMNELSSISVEEPVHLIGPLSPYEFDYEKYNMQRPVGVAEYKGPLRTPLSDSPLDARFQFKQEELVKLYVTLKSSQLMDKVVGQIEEKYGKAVKTEKPTEDQCIFRNGNSFVLKGGSTELRWMHSDGGNVIETRVASYISSVCPSSLRSGWSPLQTYSLTISVLQSDAKPKSKDNNF